MSYALGPYETRQYFDGAGDPLHGGKIEFYEAGTATPAPTYADHLGTLNPWPVQCDSEGRCAIYLGPLAYTVVVKTAAGVIVPGAGATRVIGPGAGAGGLGEVCEFGGASTAPINNTAYVSGAGLETLHPGTAVFPADSADLPGTYVLTAMGLCAPAGTLTVALMNLSDGAPDTPLAEATITSPTTEVGTSGPITWPPPGGTVKRYGIKCRVSAGTGFAWSVKLMKTAA